MNEGWQEIGMDIFDEDIWRKTDGNIFFGISYFIRKERKWNASFAIDIILMALECQTVSPITNCKYLNHMVRPLWNGIRGGLFEAMKWYNLSHHPGFNDSDDGES